MTSDDKSLFADYLAEVADFYQRPSSVTLLELYWRLLKRYSFTDIKQAFDRHALDPKRCPFMPKPGELLAYIEGSHETRALQAWSRVCAAIRCVGRYDSIVFDDALIHVVIRDMGGWVTLCQTTQRELSFQEKSFVTRYLGYLLRPPTDYPCVLFGLTAQQNGSYSEASSPALVFFGDRERALQVYRSGNDTAYAITHHTPSPLAKNSLPERKPQPPPQLHQPKVNIHSLTTTTFQEVLHEEKKLPTIIPPESSDPKTNR